MRVVNVADSCILFEHGGIRLLSDPWIGTASNGFWVQYPPPVATAETIGRLDYIFISHLHEDHCDFPTLSRLDSRARILIMDRRPNLLFDHLRNHGVDVDRVVTVPPRTTLELAPGLQIEPLEANPAHEYSRLVDSALLIHFDGKTVYFANDAEPHEGSDRYIASRYSVELAMLPFYGGSGYPACYTNLTAAEKEAEVVRIQQTYLRSMARSFSIVRPRRVTPVASWHCFAGPVAELNSTMSWPQSFDELIEFMAELGPEAPSLELFNPGQGLNLETGVRIGGAFRPHTPEDRHAFASGLLKDARPRYETIPNSPAIRLERLLEHAAESFREKLGYGFEVDFRYLFDCGEGIRYILDPHDASVSTEDSAVAPSAPYLKITLDRRLFALLLIGALSWNLEDAAGWLRYERVPNVYRPEVYVALNFLKI